MCFRMEESEATVQEQRAPIKIMIAVSKSTLKGYPHPSISSSQAFDWTLQKLIPHSCREDYQLLLLHIQVPDEDGLDDMDSIYATANDFKDMKQKEKIRGLHLLKEFVNKCNLAQVPCKCWIKEGAVKEEICKEVKRVHPDLLVVGSRGLSSIQRMFIGTVSEHCVKHVDIPVLVIKRRPEDAPDDPSDD
ncbi:hypothetical protein O6H91_04G070900 [Diphasiastrum complanatum]|uniref:Uncharacterized protein n=2 Tax=Diphasiastrum complanatum TaxID=34168 RepID=A0ACC2DXU0_DIPCM|nr:hypothetical protein O6H91_04G070900 [Diphasiastrum complanatum]